MTFLRRLTGMTEAVRAAAIRPRSVVHARALGEPSIKVRTRLMLHWAEIALAHEQEAKEARESLARSRNETLSQGKALELPRELHPSLIAVTAAASAIDALYGEVKEDVPVQPQPAGTSRHAWIFETLKRGFRVKESWSAELKWLFSGLRDSALHPRADFDSPQQHPLGVNAAPEYVVYTAESATRAVDLMLDVLVTCAERPRKPLESWSADAKQPIKNLTDARSKNT